jgi:multimeric flavodoxin WrbA
MPAKLSLLCPGRRRNSAPCYAGQTYGIARIIRALCSPFKRSALSITDAIDRITQGRGALMKLVTAFVGSTRKNGVTYAAARQFLDNLQSFGDIRGEITFLSQSNLGVCRGCKSCFERGEEHCPLKDDRDMLIEKMMDSDGVVFASPNYSFQVSAIMKTFLDRLGFVFHRPRFHGKTFTSIVVQGFFGGGKIVKYLQFVGLGLGFNVARGSCITALEPMAEIERQKMDKALLEQSRRFHEQLSKPAYPQPSIMQLMMFRGGRTSAKLLAGEENRDHTYYRDKGWFDSDYYYPTKLNPLKRAVGATVDWMTARMSKQREE